MNRLSRYQAPQKSSTSTAAASHDGRAPPHTDAPPLGTMFQSTRGDRTTNATTSPPRSPSSPRSAAGPVQHIYNRTRRRVMPRPNEAQSSAGNARRRGAPERASPNAPVDADASTVPHADDHYFAHLHHLLTEHMNALTRFERRLDTLESETNRRLDAMRVDLSTTRTPSESVTNQRSSQSSPFASDENLNSLKKRIVDQQSRIDALNESMERLLADADHVRDALVVQPRASAHAPRFADALVTSEQPAHDEQRYPTDTWVIVIGALVVGVLVVLVALFVAKCYRDARAERRVAPAGAPQANGANPFDYSSSVGPSLLTSRNNGAAQRVAYGGRSQTNGWHRDDIRDAVRDAIISLSTTGQNDTLGTAASRPFNVATMSRDQMPVALAHSPMVSGSTWVNANTDSPIALGP